MELWIWRHFRLTLPADWEMLQFSRKPEAGRCAFADRYRYRLEWSWRVVPGPPAMDRVLSDYAARLQAEGVEDVKRVRHDPWRGVAGETAEGPTTRFGRHFPEAGAMLEVVFLWPGKRDERLEQRVLAGVGAEPARGGGFRRWRAFGMDLAVPGGHALAQCAVEPAHARMTFADAKGGHEHAFERRGLVEAWLGDPVEEWLRRQTPGDVRDPVCTTDVAREHRVTRIRGRVRRPGLAGRLRRPRFYTDEAWICPGDGRLYRHARTEPGRGAESEAPAAPRLSCCGLRELRP
jgi:hypothetical protein